jgi:hypothetical protein
VDKETGEASALLLRACGESFGGTENVLLIGNYRRGKKYEMRILPISDKERLVEEKNITALSFSKREHHIIPDVLE